LGRAEEAVEMCRLALQLNPRDPYNYWRHSYIALAHFVAADYEAALQEKQAGSSVETAPPEHNHLGGGGSSMAKPDEARTAVERCGGWEGSARYYGDGAR